MINTSFCIAYIGPGAGMAAMTALAALGTTVFAAMGFLLAKPFRWLYRRLRGLPLHTVEPTEPGVEEPGKPDAKATK